MNSKLIPSDNWSLNRLGKFAQKIAKRNAHDCWLLGCAYGLAKAKAKAEGQMIEEWRKQWIPFLSQPTLCRYEAVSKMPEEEVMDKSVTEVYRLLGLAPKKPSTEDADNGTGAPSTTASPEGHTTLNMVPSEPDSLLKRVASIVTMLDCLVNDLDNLDVKAEGTQSLDDALDECFNLLDKIRGSVRQQGVAA